MQGSNNVTGKQAIEFYNTRELECFEGCLVNQLFLPFAAGSGLMTSIRVNRRGRYCSPRGMDLRTLGSKPEATHSHWAVFQ